MLRDNPIVIGLDQGTTNVKAVALDGKGRVLAQAARPIATSAPEPGIVEQDAEAIFSTAIACIRDAIAQSGRGVRDVIALGIANQTETLIIWNAQSGKPVMPAMIWQDRRGADEIAQVQKDTTAIRARTGLDLDPTFSAAKLAWVSRNKPEIATGLHDGTLLFGTVDTWLIWELTGGATYATDASNASRTMLFDIERLAWSDELLRLFDLKLARLPHCHASNGNFGNTDPSHFGAAVPIRGVLGDQQASLFGQGCFAKLQLKVTYGTGAFLWMNAGNMPPVAPPAGIIRTIAWLTGEPCYAYEGFVMYAGKIIDWLAARLAIGGGAAGTIKAAEAAGDSHGVLLLPAFQGLASPWWSPAMRAAILGLSEATTNGDIAHAGLEAVAFQIRAIVDSLTSESHALSTIKVDGGLTRSPYFLKMQASLLDHAVSPASSDSVTPFGAALMAGLGAGLWPSTEALRPLIPEAGRIDADKVWGERLERRYRAWARAIDMMIEHGGGSA